MNTQPSPSWSEDDDRQLREYAAKYDNLTGVLQQENTVTVPLSMWSQREELIQRIDAKMQCWRLAAITLGGLFVTLAVAYVWTLLKIAN